MKINIVKLLVWSFLLNTLWSFSSKTNTGPYEVNLGALWKLENKTISLKRDYDYKIDFDITTTSNDPSIKNKNINSIARVYNMLGQNEMTKNNIHVALVINSSASKDVMNNQLYKVKYNANNTNISLITELVEAHLDVIFCGQ